MKSLGKAVVKVAAPILGRRGFGEAQMILEWPAVVGVDLARDTLPVKLSFKGGDRIDGTLHLLVANGAAPVVQHLGSLVIERINGFFGYRAVARLAMRQGPLPARATQPARPKPRPLSDREQQQLDQAIGQVADPALRQSLDQLGRMILGRASLATPEKSR